MAVRGAITCDADTPAEIDRRTQQVVREMLERNALAHDDIISIFFTATEDLTSQFPATGARAMGLGDVPLICAREIPVPGSLPLVVRVLMHVHTDLPRDRIAHVYLEGARVLRDDLPG
ncbi:MAG: chorismate mutase [Actinomycetes bacterium]